MSEAFAETTRLIHNAIAKAVQKHSPSDRDLVTALAMELGMLCTRLHFTKTQACELLRASMGLLEAVYIDIAGRPIRCPKDGGELEFDVSVPEIDHMSALSCGCGFTFYVTTPGIALKDTEATP